MAEHNIKISQDADGDISVKEHVFYQYLSGVRGLLVELLMNSRDLAQYAEALKSGKEFDEAEQRNFIGTISNLEKNWDRVAKFNKWIESYDELRKAAYEFFKM